MLPILISFLLLAIILDYGLFIFAIFRKDRSRSVYFALLTFALLIYSLGYAIEVMCQTPHELMQALRIENAGIPFIAPLFALTGISLFDRQSLKKWMLPAAAAFGAFIFIIVFFNDRHFLYYTRVDLVYNGSRHYAVLGKGPIYFVMQAYCIVIMLLAFVNLTRVMLKGGKQRRRMMHSLLVGSVLVFAANILNFSGILPSIDFTPIMLSFAMLFFARDIVKYNLLDIITIAQDSAMQSMDDAVIIVDSDWQYMFANQSAKKLFPGLHSALEMKLITSAEGWPKELAPVKQPRFVNFSLNEFDPVLRRRYRANISNITVAGDEPAGWSIVIRDMTDIFELMQQYEDLAKTDSLTGVLNRRHFLVRVEEEKDLAVRHNLWQSLIMYDIDFFKKINDRYGHIAGDYVLRETVEIVKRNLRPHDFMGRFGGEEFVVYLISNQNDSLQNIADRLCKAIDDAEFTFNGQKIHVTISVGAVLISPLVAFSTALEIADAAMYEAKRLGRNRAVLGHIEVDMNGNPIAENVKLHVSKV